MSDTNASDEETVTKQVNMNGTIRLTYCLKNSNEKLKNWLSSAKVKYTTSNGGQKTKKNKTYTGSKDQQTICTVTNDTNITLPKKGANNDLLRTFIATESHYTKVVNNPNNTTKTKSSGTSNSGVMVNGHFDNLDSGHMIYQVSVELVGQIHILVQSVNSYFSARMSAQYNTNSFFFS